MEGPRSLEELQGTTRPIARTAQPLLALRHSSPGIRCDSTSRACFWCTDDSLVLPHVAAKLEGLLPNGEPGTTGRRASSSRTW